MFKPSAIIQHFKDLRGYIGFSFVLFFASIVIGGTNEGFEAFLSGQLEGLGQLVDMVESSPNQTLFMTIIIFLNNAIKSILIMYLGAFYGIIPFFFLITNGMIIGYMLKIISNNPDALPVWEVIIKGLLPHGIIEIPAIIFACAYGFKFGTLVFRASGSMLFARGKLGGIGKEIEHFAIRTVPMIVILTVALLIASVIESTFTTWLLG